MFFPRLTQISSLILASLITLNSYADVKIGANPTSISSNATLEVEATNGSKVLIDKANGRVGVGTTAPTNPLHVQASSDPIKLEGVVSGNISTDKVAVLDNSGVVKQVGTLSDALASIDIPQPALFILDTNQSNFLSAASAGSSTAVPMAQYKSSIPGLTYNSATSTITFPAGTYMFNYAYEADHNATGCDLSSYFVDFPNGAGATRIHSTGAHLQGGSSNHGGAITYATQITAGRTWQIHLGRGQSGNCTGAGMTLKARSTQILIYRLGS